MQGKEWNNHPGGFSRYFLLKRFEERETYCARGPKLPSNRRKALHWSTVCGFFSNEGNFGVYAAGGIVCRRLRTQKGGPFISAVRVMGNMLAPECESLQVFRRSCFHRLSAALRAAHTNDDRQLVHRKSDRVSGCVAYSQKGGQEMRNKLQNELTAKVSLDLIRGQPAKRRMRSV